MKVYTITCHDVYNHGASLQAYALMKYLMKCGHDVEIIDYKPNYLSNHYKLLSIDNPKWAKSVFTKFIYLTLKLPGRLQGLRRKKSFDKFTTTYLRLTNFHYYSNEDLKKNLPIADAYICGSDQIWNSSFENGKDPAFYLNFAPEDKVKASYAASFATDSISPEITPVVKKNLERLDEISVREKSGIKIIGSMGISRAVNVVDPTLLLTREEWNKIGNQKFNGNYILIYDFDNSNLIKKVAMDIAKEKGYQIYSINPGNIKYADKYFKYVGPDTFISLIRDAAFVISNSYHAAVFSVLYRKNFAIINRNESINTRMRDFLIEMKLGDRLIDENYDSGKLLSKVNHGESEKILQEKIVFSKEYLKDIMISERGMRKVL
ncbi:polysaccharide pyruvyl transferase family protein [Oceanobacillus saliphilus]|uniref:polysaccharide pyruvyl transferase family protein n=1 Tax=Oceanobacillus saliphilus TaxID=2925834 RepID=UPI00201E22A6|nr:polysaccharide pyruvyl transferase family protein [Oceanobacillus saliphilus]